MTTRSASRKNPALAAALSLVPGLGHVYAGASKKAPALFCIDAGLLLALTARSYVVTSVAALMYLATLAQSAVDAFLLAQGREGLRDSRAYVVLMLLCTGLTALPLLWQSGAFSRRAKVAWSAAVPALAAAWIGALMIWGPEIEKWMRRT